MAEAQIEVESQIEALRNALESQVLLQREGEHRIKNNLQLISSIVLLQGRRSADDAARRALKAVHQRVTAVSLAHRHVGRNGSAEHVEVAGLVRELVGELAASAGRDDIAITLDLEPVEAPARAGAPIALLLNEALGNALTHAFPDARPGRIEVSVRRTSDGFTLCVADDGVGLPNGAPRGFGTTILQMLTQQLRGQLETVPAQPGLKVAVRVPMDEAQP